MIIQEYITTFKFALRHEQYYNFIRLIRNAKDQIKQLGLSVHFWTAVGLGASIAGLTEIAFHSAKSIDKLGDMGEKLGLTAEEMRQWGYAAKQASIPLEAFEVGIKQFGRNMADAATGKAPKILQRFQELNVELQDINGHTRHWKDVILDVADAFAGMTPEKKTEQLGYALKFMGRTGEEFVQVLNYGAPRIRQMLDDAKKYGHEITEQEREDADVFIKTWDSFKESLTGLLQEVGTSLTPAATGFVEMLRDAVVGLKNGITSLRKEFDKLRKALDTTDEWFRRIAFDLLMLLTPFILYYTQALWVAIRAQLFHVAAQILVALRNGQAALSFRALAAATWTAVAAVASFLAKLILLATILAVFDDIWVFLKGGNSIIGQLTEAWLKNHEAVRKVERAMVRIAALYHIIAGFLSAPSNPSQSISGKQFAADLNDPAYRRWLEWKMDDDRWRRALDNPEGFLRERDRSEIRPSRMMGGMSPVNLPVNGIDWTRYFTAPKAAAAAPSNMSPLNFNITVNAPGGTADEIARKIVGAIRDNEPTLQTAYGHGGY